MTQNYRIATPITQSINGTTREMGFSFGMKA